MVGPSGVHFIFFFRTYDAGFFYFRDFDGKGEGEMNRLLYCLHKRYDSCWPVNFQFFLPIQQRHGLKKPRQTKHVVSVHVGDENLCFSMKAYASLNHLPLDAFAAVEEEQFVFSSN